MAKLPRRRKGSDGASESLSLGRFEAFHAGPLPPASELERYEALLPGLADRIVRMAESNAGHRQGLERAVVDGNLRAQTRGQVFAFALSLCVLGAGVWLVAADKTTIGLWLILGDLAALAAVFITGRVLQQRERRERRLQLEEGRRPDDEARTSSRR